LKGYYIWDEGANKYCKTEITKLGTTKLSNLSVAVCTVPTISSQTPVTYNFGYLSTGENES